MLELLVPSGVATGALLCNLRGMGRCVHLLAQCGHQRQHCKGLSLRPKLPSSTLWVYYCSASLPNCTPRTNVSLIPTCREGARAGGGGKRVKQ